VHLVLPFTRSNCMRSSGQKKIGELPFFVGEPMCSPLVCVSPTIGITVGGTFRATSVDENPGIRITSATRLKSLAYSYHGGTSASVGG
jgi:hypothetical protein